MNDFEVRTGSDEVARGLGDGTTAPPDRSFELDSQAPRKPGISIGFSRAKSSLRLKYEAETQVIQKKLGSLESMRAQLGISQRKMSQLLLVDPSAWTRWTKGGASAKDQAPPHIYRMLQWYLALEEKYPALDVNFWLNTVSQVSANSQQSDLRKELAESVRLTSTLRSRIEQLEMKAERSDAAATPVTHLKNNSNRLTPSPSEPSQFKRFLVATFVAALVVVSALAVGFWIGQGSIR